MEINQKDLKEKASLLFGKHIFDLWASIYKDTRRLLSEVDYDDYNTEKEKICKKIIELNKMMDKRLLDMAISPDISSELLENVMSAFKLMQSDLKEIMKKIDLVYSLKDEVVI